MPQVHYFSFLRSPELPRPPFEPCDTSISTVFPNYTPEWCGKRAPAGYEAFRKAFADYQAAMAEAGTIMAGVGEDLLFSCMIYENSTGPQPADPMEVELIVQRLSFSGRPALDRANEAWNRLKFAQQKAFAGDPAAGSAAADVAALNDVITAYGRGIMNLEDAGELFKQCTTHPAMLAARSALEQQQASVGAAFTQMTGLYTKLEAEFQATQKVCKTVRVREEISAKDIRKAGAPATKSSGGATLVYPKTFDVGHKSKMLPLNVTSPAAGRATVSVKRGSKGIVATGGWVAEGAFGLLMSVPGGTKTGKVTVTFRLDSGVTVTGKVTLM